ncbi:hypothetical protein JXM67_01930 [candidate division WOR-3 bacterium]|nr:hypothetical protein [candidate division WOR-3 bacterium]
MNKGHLPFVSFKQTSGGQFKGFLSIDFALREDVEPKHLLQKATEVYEKNIKKMRKDINEMKLARETHTHISARKAWEVGDKIFKLKDDLAALGVQIDGVYRHLIRDLNVRRKWLEKIIIFRRYIFTESAIPKGLNWGKCSKVPKRSAERIVKGLTLD